MKSPFSFINTLCVIAGLTRNPIDLLEIAGQARNDDVVFYATKILFGVDSRFKNSRIQHKNLK